MQRAHPQLCDSGRLEHPLAQVSKGTVVDARLGRRDARFLVAMPTCPVIMRAALQVVKVRKVVQVAAFAGPALALMLLTVSQVTSGMAMALFTVALGVQSLGQAGFVANMSDVAPDDAGQLFGLCNTFGSLAGIVGVSAAGVLLEATGSFNALFYVSAVLYAAGAVVFGLWAQGEPAFGGKTD